MYERECRKCVCVKGKKCAKENPKVCEWLNVQSKCHISRVLPRAYHTQDEDFFAKQKTAENIAMTVFIVKKIFTHFWFGNIEQRM
jgi:hypothetical protein